MAPDFITTAKQQKEEKRLAARVTGNMERIIDSSNFNHNPDGQTNTGFSQLSKVIEFVQFTCSSAA